MKHRSWKVLVLASAAALFVACKDTLTPSLVSDAQLTNDVATSAGNAVASTIWVLDSNATTAALPGSQPSANVAGSAQASDSFVVVRSRVCLDGTGTVIACSNIANVRKVITTASINGSRTGIFFTGKVHRSALDTLTRVFTNTTETSRIHSGVMASHDTTTFQDSSVTALHAENASDSINAVTWNLPRSTNPFPVSGSIVRNVAIHATFQNLTTSVTRDFVKRVEVDFPADAQGNVVLKIDAKVCNLNLVTRAVTNCH